MTTGAAAAPRPGDGGLPSERESSGRRRPSLEQRVDVEIPGDGQLQTQLGSTIGSRGFGFDFQRVRNTKDSADVARGRS